MANPALSSTNTARKKGGAKLGEIYSDTLPPLSDDDAAGVEALLNGESAAAAWRLAHPDSQAQPQSSWVRAGEWVRRKDIVLWVEAGKQARLAKITDTAVAHYERLTALISKCERSGNYGAAVQAEIALGRAMGHYVERSEITIRRSQSPDLIIQAIERLLGADAAQSAALKLGIQYNQTLTHDIPHVDMAYSAQDDCLNVEHDVDNDS